MTIDWSTLPYAPHGVADAVDDVRHGFGRIQAKDDDLGMAERVVRLHGGIAFACARGSGTGNGLLRASSRPPAIDEDDAFRCFFEIDGRADAICRILRRSGQINDATKKPSRS